MSEPDQRRRRIEHQDIVPIVDHYVSREGYEIVGQEGEWYLWECPGCGNETLRANVEWGKAGCLVDDCPVPELERWQGIVLHFEGEENIEGESERERLKQLKGIALSIIGEHEAKERKKQEADREAEQDRERKEEEAEQKDLERKTAQSPAEQQLLDDFRSRQAQDQREERRREMESRHYSAKMRVLAAESYILEAELLWAVVVGVAVLASFYYGISWLDSFAVRPSDILLTGLPLYPNEPHWELFLRRLVGSILPGWILLVRLPVGILLGALAGGWTGLSLAGARRRRYFLLPMEHEYLSFYHPSKLGGDDSQITWADTGAPSPERLSRETHKRFFGGIARAFTRPLVVLAGFLSELGFRELPWGGILWRFVLAAVSYAVSYYFVKWISPGASVWALPVAMLVGFFILFTGLIGLARQKTW